MSENDVPVVLDVEDFTRARREATENLLTALRTPKDGQRSFQRLAFEYRRRTQSHNPFRIPRRCRAPVLRDFATAPPLASKRPRKDRRRPKDLRAAFEKREVKARWLETHLWSAKRMHMVSLFGWKLALRPTQKCRRKMYRYALQKTAMYDRSWFSTIEIEGSETDLSEALKRLGRRSQISSDGTRPLPARAQCSFTVVIDEKIVGPVEFIHASRPDRSRVLWLFCHPEITSDIKKALDYLTESHIRELDDVCCFELYGPQALLHLARVLGFDGLQALSEPLRRLFASAQPEVWQLLRDQAITIPITTPSILGPSPPHRPLILPSATIDVPELARDLVPELQRSLLLPNSIYDEAHCAQDPDRLTFKLCRRSAKRRSGQVLLLKARAAAEKRSLAEVKTAETMCQAQDQTQAKMATGLKAVSEETGDATKDMGDADSVNFDPYVQPKREIVTQPCLITFASLGQRFPLTRVYFRKGTIGRTLWTLLARQKCRSMGLEDRRHLYLEAETRHFPEVWPLSQSGDLWATRIFEQLSSKWDRTPASKRPNYTKLQTDFPFGLTHRGFNKEKAIRPWIPTIDKNLHEQIWIALRRESFSSFDADVFLPVKVFALSRGQPDRFATLHFGKTDAIAQRGCLQPLAQAEPYPETQMVGFVCTGNNTLSHGKGIGLGYVRMLEWLNAIRRQAGHSDAMQRKYEKELGASSMRLPQTLQHCGQVLVIVRRTCAACFWAIIEPDLG